MKNETPEAVPRVAAAKVERTRLHDAVIGQLRDLIVEGTLAPGVKINERELCETFGISRTPLREAMKVLAAEGLVDITPNRGASVARMSLAEISDAFELMGALEALSGELACARITAAEIAEIKQSHQAMLACHADNDLPGYYSRNQAIHDKINAAARNAMLRLSFTSLNRRLVALRFKSNQAPAKWQRAVQDHADMIEALDARDGQRLGAILRRHLLDKRDAILGGLVAGANNLIENA